MWWILNPNPEELQRVRRIFLLLSELSMSAFRLLFLVLECFSFPFLVSFLSKDNKTVDTVELLIIVSVGNLLRSTLVKLDKKDQP